MRRWHTQPIHLKPCHSYIPANCHRSIKGMNGTGMQTPESRLVEKSFRPNEAGLLPMVELSARYSRLSNDDTVPVRLDRGHPLLCGWNSRFPAGARRRHDRRPCSDAAARDRHSTRDRCVDHFVVATSSGAGRSLRPRSSCQSAGRDVSSSWAPPQAQSPAPGWRVFCIHAGSSSYSA